MYYAIIWVFQEGEKKNHTDDEVSKTHEKKLYVSNMVH